MAVATASHEATSITIVNSRLISASTFPAFVLHSLITDSLVPGMLRLIDQWRFGMTVLIYCRRITARKGYTRSLTGSMISVQIEW